MILELTTRHENGLVIVAHHHWRVITDQPGPRLVKHVQDLVLGQRAQLRVVLVGRIAIVSERVCGFADQGLEEKRLDVCVGDITRLVAGMEVIQIIVGADLIGLIEAHRGLGQSYLAMPFIGRDRLLGFELFRAAAVLLGIRMRLSAGR